MNNTGLIGVKPPAPGGEDVDGPEPGEGGDQQLPGDGRQVVPPDGELLHAALLLHRLHHLYRLLPRHQPGEEGDPGEGGEAASGEEREDPQVPPVDPQVQVLP